MPRRRVPTRISDADVRLVAGRMVFAAAAEALGGIYGPIVMERALAFSPRARAERRASKSAGDLPWAKRPLPTGACKKWLEGHVPIDQTLALIAESHPLVAGRMQRARDSEVLKALCVAKADYRFVANRIAVLSPELFGEYLGCMALGGCNPNFASRLAAGLLQQAMAGKGADVLVAVLGSERQLPSPRGAAAAKSLEAAFHLALDQVARSTAEVAFSKAAIADVWANRRASRRPVPQQFVTKLRKLPQFATN